MALRLIELILSVEASSDIQALLTEQPVIEIQCVKLADGMVLVRVLLEAERSQEVLDLLEERFSSIAGFRVLLLPVEATMPLPPPKETQPKDVPAPESGKKPTTPERISREELYTDVTDAMQLSKVYLAMVVLSSVVATVGLISNNMAVIIGAMVIAPLLGPNVALALATTLGDLTLAREAVKTSLMGIFAAAVLSVGLGFGLKVDPHIPEIMGRTQVGLTDVALALASGCAGALAFTTGVSATLIGVMVAVALLPPLVTFGLLLGSGYWEMSLRALELFLSNLICVNLAGVVTFLIQGIRPLTWWEANRARKATRVAICLWALTLAALIAVIVLSHRI